MNVELESLNNHIRKAQSILLTTHKQCDGDGLGSVLGLSHSLKQLNKTIRAMSVDEIPKKYVFLDTDTHIENFENLQKPLESMDLALILDTNDHRLVEPLYSELEKKCKKIIFIDHHPRLLTGPSPTEDSYIDEKAASTGEITFNLIQSLKLQLNKDIARAIYTSIAFDTHLFRYVRNSPASHLIAAELLKYETNPAEVHRCLFANHSAGKILFLAQALKKIEYYNDQKIAVLRLDQGDLDAYKMGADDSRDLIDMIMNIDTLIAGATIRQEPSGNYKLSLRSKGQIEVRQIAEFFGGGGHLYASGATVSGAYDEIKNKLVAQLTELINNHREQT